MFAPEYTVTSNILKSITAIEYNRALIDNLNILPNFEKRMEKEAITNFLVSTLQFMGELPNFEVIKQYVDGLTNMQNPKIVGLSDSLRHINNLAATYEIDEKDIKFLHAVTTKGFLPVSMQGLYRSTKVNNKVEPETILAEINDLIDWFNGLDAMDTNPTIAAGIFKGQLETILPFEKYNFVVANLCVKIIFRSRGYRFEQFIVPENYYAASNKTYEQNLTSIVFEEGDFTAWLEYFTEGITAQVATVADKIKLYAKDTKVAKASGRINLSKRQEKIVEYLQDYGLIKNQQFALLFPDISEDSVLRDLKTLVDSGIIVKRGKTKSSRYELR